MMVMGVVCLYILFCPVLLEFLGQEDRLDFDIPHQSMRKKNVYDLAYSNKNKNITINHIILIIH